MRRVAVASVSTLLLFATWTIATQGCSAPELEAPNAQTEVLSRYNSTYLFGKNDTIPVCWLPLNAPNCGSYCGGATQLAKDWVQHAVENSWMNVTNVKFVGWHECDSTSTNYLTINGTAAVSVSQTTCVGKGDNSSVGIETQRFAGCIRSYAPGSTPTVSLGMGSGVQPDVEYQAVHEFGHILGYQHEQDQDAGYGDPGYVPATKNGSVCAPTGSWNVGADVWVPSTWNFSDDLATVYDPDSVMNYCHNIRDGNSGRLSILDVLGVQQPNEYGAPARLDMDGDGEPDLSDNCPYAQNGGDQLDSNFDAELVVQLRANPSCGQPWGCEDGHRPTGADSVAYVNHWHLAYPGDACDAISVTATKPDQWPSKVEQSGPQQGGCLDLPAGTTNSSETCPLTLNTRLNFDGHNGGPAGMAVAAPYRPGSQGRPSFCACTKGSAKLCNNSQDQCFVGQDLAYVYAFSPTASNFKQLSHEVCNPNCTTETFPELTIPHMDPTPGYDAQTVAETWDFLADYAQFGKLQRFNDMPGVGWMHEHDWTYRIISGPTAGSGPTDLSNNYWVQTVHWEAKAYHLGASFQNKWLPVPYCDPTPKQGVDHVIKYMTTANTAGTPVALGLTGSTMYDLGASLTANAKGLLFTLPGGNDMLTADDRIGAQPSTSTGYNAIVLNGGTPKIVGAIQDSGTMMDGVLASAVVGSGVASLRSFSATNQALYWLSQDTQGNWQLNTRLLSNALAGNATTALVTLSGMSLQSPRGIAYNRVTNTLFVADWISLSGANAIRLLSTNLTSGVTTELWTTASFSVSPVPAIFVSTTVDGEAIVSVSPTSGTGAIDILLVNSKGRPTASYTTTGRLQSAVVGKGDGITIPLAQTATDTTPNIQIQYVKRSLLKYGACNSTLFLGIASPPSQGAGTKNPGFEYGDLTLWTPSGASATLSATARSGAYAVLLGLATPTNGDSTVSQTLTAPTGATSLSFWYQMTCPDTVTFDWATAILTDNTTNLSTTILAKTCATNTWTKVTANVTGGHVYTLALTSHDDNYGADPTFTLYDDLSFAPGPTGALNDGMQCP